METSTQFTNQTRSQDHNFIKDLVALCALRDLTNLSTSLHYGKYQVYVTVEKEEDESGED